MPSDESSGNPCLSERQLVALATGDGAGAGRRHAEGCGTCATRLTALADDLRLIVTALRPDGVAAPPRRPSRRLVWIGGATAVAAAVLATVALGLGVRAGNEGASVPAPADQRAFLESISRSLFMAHGYDRSLLGSYPHSSEPGRGCGWGSLSMPCEVAWAADEDRAGR